MRLEMNDLDEVEFATNEVIEGIEDIIYNVSQIEWIVNIMRKKSLTNL